MKFTVFYFTTEGVERRVTVKADDQAAAIGLVLDQHDDIAPDSPMGVWENKVHPRVAELLAGLGLKLETLPTV